MIIERDPLKILEDISQSIKEKRATTPSSLHQTAFGIWVARTLLSEIDPIYLKDVFLITEDQSSITLKYLPKFPGDYRDYELVSFKSEAETWEVRRKSHYKLKPSFEIWWKPNRLESDLAGGQLYEQKMTKVDYSIKPGQILNVSSRLLEAHTRTPIEKASAA